MGVDLPAGLGLLRVATPGVDGDHDALTTERFRTFTDHRRILQRGGVDGNLVGPCTEDFSYIFRRTQATAHGERYKHLIGHAPDQVGDNRSLVRRRGDVEKSQFVGPFNIVSLPLFDRVSRINQRNEANPFNDAAVVNIEARNDSFRQHSN
jgi:hypothetical protein